MDGTISAIVPALDEREEIEETLIRARRALGPDAELLVVDGGSRDGTPAVAARHARVLDSEPCRGLQLDRGAEAARGDILVFLHADTWLEPGAADAIRGAVAGGAGAGCGRFAVRTSGWRYRLLERGVNWRTRAFRTATGDQALFATRDAYRAAGGFGPHPLFEDVRLVRALRRVVRFEPIDTIAATSSRRWVEGGFLRTVLAHWALRLWHAFGTDPSRLARRYGSRGSGRSGINRPTT